MRPKRRRVWVLVVSGALLFAVVERLSRTDTPMPAAAATTTTSRQVSIELSPKAMADLLSSLRAAPDATRRVELEQDLFLPPALPVVEEPQPHPIADEQTTKFATHRLDGVLIGPTSFALVDGRALQVGAIVDGYRLVQIRRNFAMFARGDERIQLRVRQSSSSR